jgi:hypothetical protein
MSNQTWLTTRDAARYLNVKERTLAAHLVPLGVATVKSWQG